MPTEVLTEANYDDLDDGLNFSNAGGDDGSRRHHRGQQHHHQLALDGSWAARAARAEAAASAARRRSSADGGGQDGDDDGKLRFLKFDVSDIREVVNGAEAAAPPDRCAFTYISFIVLGIGLLLPWNAILQSVGLFTSPVMFGVCSDIVFVMSAANMASFLVVMLALLYIDSKCRVDGRIYVALGFLIRTVAIAVFAARGVELGYWVCVAMVILDGIGGGLAQYALFGLAAVLPPRFTSATMFGNGISGVLVTAIYFVIVWVYAEDAKAKELDAWTNATNETGAEYTALIDSAVTMYYGSAVFSFGCFFLTLLLSKSPFYMYYRAKANRKPPQSVELLDSDAPRRPVEAGRAAGAPAEDGTGLSGIGKICFVFRLLWIPAVSVFFILFVCLAVYPGVLVSTTPIEEPGIFLLSEWVVAIFNVGDCAGRFLPRWSVLVIKNPRLTWAPALIMILWFALSFLSGLDFFKSDAVTYTVTLLFAISNGYASTICMMMGPTLVPDNLKELAGNIMVLMMLVGLTLGSFVGIGLEAAILESEVYCNGTA